MPDKCRLHMLQGKHTTAVYVFVRYSDHYHHIRRFGSAWVLITGACHKELHILMTYLLQSLLDHGETFLAHLACSNQTAPHLRKCAALSHFDIF